MIKSSIQGKNQELMGKREIQLTSQASHDKKFNPREEPRVNG